ncbi:MAG: hypothetical protein Q7R92_00835 [bacterium]|nr:hypothetical protein [bacterium]
MLNIIRKKPVENSQTPDVPGTSGVSGEKQINLDKIAIHAMPEHFRHQTAKVKSAKTAGIVIIAGGGFLLIAASLGLYYYLFRTPAPAVQSQPAALNSAPDDQNQNQPAVEQNTAGLATTTEPATLPADNDLAASTASTTSPAGEPGMSGDSLKSGLDSDNDSLTDAEEDLLGAATSTPDTDGDGYPDGTELINLYDPASQGKLTDNPHIALYENKTFNYGALYPKVWEQSSNGGDDSVMFKSADNQFIQIVVQPNPDKQPLDQWYIDQLGVASVSEANRAAGANWQGIKSLDGLTLYLTDSRQNYIFSLTYNPTESNILEYIDIFQMMIKSFALK